MEKPNLLDYIDTPDKEILDNDRVISLSKINWGKTIQVVNQYVQKSLLNHFLKDDIEFCYTVEEDIAKQIMNENNIDYSNNSRGFNLILKLKDNNRILKIQTKLRQVEGKTPFSRQVNFETTRRNSEKSIKSKSNITGHVARDENEFDFVIFSLIHNNRNLNFWKYSIIKIDHLKNPNSDNRSLLLTQIPSILLEKYFLEDISLIKKENFI